jgi:hypothetical protein
MADENAAPARGNKTLALDVIEDLADLAPAAFEDFWEMLPEEQDKLVELYGTSSDLTIWRQRNG